MPPRGRAPRYDEIIRKTVPDPDTSWRPSPEQVRQAFAGFRALDPEEQALHDRVCEMLAANDLDRSVQVEVDHAQVTLRGQVTDIPTLERTGQLVAGVEGVDKVIDKLVVAPSTPSTPSEERRG